MSLSIEFEPQAAREVEHAVDWYEGRRAGLGSDFLRIVDVTVDRIAQRRLPGSPVPGIAIAAAVKRVPIPRFPYQIRYLILDDVIRVLAVAHDAQRPRYWADRMTE